MTIQKYKITDIPVLNGEQIERLSKLVAMSDSEIDYSDIPESLDWDNAIQGSIVNPNEMLD